MSGSRVNSRDRDKEGFKFLMLDLGGPSRENYGVIATAQNMQTGKTVSMHEAGKVLVAVAALAKAVDALGEEWRIVSLSTPHSIFRDMQGTRYDRTIDDMRQTSHDPRTSETSLLGRVGRLDLLAPLGAPRRDTRPRRVA